MNSSGKWLDSRAKPQAKGNEVLRTNRAEIEQQISDIIDEVSVQDLTPSVALRQIMYFLDLYGHKQRMLGIDEMVTIYEKRIKR